MEGRGDLMTTRTHGLWEMDLLSVKLQEVERKGCEIYEQEFFFERVAVT